MADDEEAPSLLAMEICYAYALCTGVKTGKNESQFRAICLLNA